MSKHIDRFRTPPDAVIVHDFHAPVADTPASLPAGPRRAAPHTARP